MKKAGLIFAAIAGCMMASQSFAATKADVEATLTDAKVAFDFAKSKGYVWMQKNKHKKKFKDGYYGEYTSKAAAALAKSDYETALYYAQQAKLIADATVDQYNAGIDTKPSWEK